MSKVNVRQAHSLWLKLLRRRSPLYLHLKLYTVASLVSVITARPVSKRVDVQADRNPPIRLKRSGGLRTREQSVIQTGLAQVLQRWWTRTKDLVEVKKLVKQYDQDIKRFPELQRGATVRLANEPSPEEEFLLARKQSIRVSLASYLSGDVFDQEDAPIIAIGGSGGGFRAMLSFAAFLDCVRQTGLWDITTYVAGVSGSCWTIASLYTHAELSTAELMRHYEALSDEECHPMSLAAFDRVARSRRGNYFLFGPLIRKGWEGGRAGGLMDLYSTLTTGYLLLPRNGLHDREISVGLSRSGMLWSRVYHACKLGEGSAPLPVLTAARVVIKESQDVPVPSKDAGLEDASEASLGKPVAQSHFRPGAEWWDFTPLEAGSADVSRNLRSVEAQSAFQSIGSPTCRRRGAYVPTWSFGRPFDGGDSVGRPTPELCLSLVLGHCTSAPAGPLTGYISALLSTLPRHTVMSWMLRKFNTFLLWKTWRRRWGNPIRSSKEWNPFWGMLEAPSPATVPGIDTVAVADGTKGFADSSIQDSTKRTKHSAAPAGRSPAADLAVVDRLRKIKLVDAGVSNNLPAHVFHTEQRKSDIFIGWDASSDVQTLGGCFRRVKDFGDERGLDFVLAAESKDLSQWLARGVSLQDEDQPLVLNERLLSMAEDTDLAEAKKAATLARDGSSREAAAAAHADDLERRFWKTGHHCIVFDGVAKREDDAGPSVTKEHWPPDFVYVYVPLLPCPDLLRHQATQDLFVDPSCSSFATSYNLVWTRKEAQSIFAAVRGTMLRPPEGHDRIPTQRPATDSVNTPPESATLEKIRRVVRRVALAKRRQRISREEIHTEEK